MLPLRRPGAVRWTIGAAALLALTYVAALSSEFYQLTSPATLSWHVALRKAYSIVAFALVGYVARRALVERGRTRVVLPVVAGIALYSGAIEVGQYLLGSDEGPGWNAFDIACGAVGGALAVADRMARFERGRPERMEA